jgi:zeaxanthin glucosyltransferase
MKILFKVFPQKSHYNATFPLARALREAGHEIVYAGLVQMRGHAEAQGFTYHVEAEDVYPYFENARTQPHLTFWHMLRHWAGRLQPARVMRTRFGRGAFFDTLLRATKPDLILMDSPYTFHALTLYRHKIPFAMLESMMNLDRAPGIPPMDTTYVPDGSRLSRWICALHWQRYFIKRAILGFVGMRADFDRRFVLRMARAWGVDPKVISFDRYFHLGLRDVPELILSPCALDFPRTLAPNQHYVGLPPDLTRKEVAADYRFNRIFERLAGQRAEGRPLVYCSLGTGAWRYAGAERFLHRVIEAARGQRWNLILTAGEFAMEQFVNLPPNAAVFQVVPQLAVLRQADLMITHGGVNSITECALLGVPMLVCPGTRKIDQAGNAARVIYHGLGLDARMACEITASLRSKIEKVISSSSYCLQSDKIRGRLGKASLSAAQLINLQQGAASLPVWHSQNDHAPKGKSPSSKNSSACLCR